MQKGFQNEIDFKNFIDHKQIKNLPDNMQQLLGTLFKDVKEDSLVYCWKSKYLEKADIKIRINGIIKGISIKTGKQCSIHQEHKNKLSFLIKNRSRRKYYKYI